MSIAAILLAGLPQRTYATWNPADKGSGITLSGGNLVASSTASYMSVRATIGLTSGKWYWEVLLGGSGYWFVGVANASQSLNAYLFTPNSTGRQSNGYYWNSVASTSDGLSFAAGDVLGCKLNKDAGTLEILKNNSSLGAIEDLQSGTVYPAFGNYIGTETATVNFGASAFTYPVPSGYNPGVFT